MKYNPMFSMRSTNDMKKFYMNPSVIVGALALILVIVSCFIPFYNQPNGIAVSVEWLVFSEFKSVILPITIMNVVLVLATLVFSIIFKNTPKLSALTMVIGGIILFGAIFELLYCTKIGFPNDSNGTTVANFSLYYGSIAVIVASLLIIGNEFYKLGWQGYEVKEEAPATVETNKENTVEQEQETMVVNDDNSQVNKLMNDEKE